jgi:tRNA threonylcarbamoyladenosine biosynthesis protein TsaE
MKIIVHQMEDWDLLAQQLLPKLKPGTILALSGPLGAGKTALVQAIARALGVKSNPRSPTFSLLRTYKVSFDAIKNLVHVDAYRLDEEKDALALGLDEVWLEPGTIMAVEWPEKLRHVLPRLTQEMIQITITPDPQGNVRRVEVV